MKALLSTAPGGPDTLVLTDVPDLAPGSGQILVRVRACAINYPDVLIIEDKYQFKPQRPFAPGGEIAGEVAALGEGVTDWSVGDRVIAMLGHGGLQEQVLVDAKAALRLPPGSVLVISATPRRRRHRADSDPTLASGPGTGPAGISRLPPC